MKTNRIALAIVDVLALYPIWILGFLMVFDEDETLSASALILEKLAGIAVCFAGLLVAVYRRDIAAIIGRTARSLRRKIFNAIG